MSNKFKVGEKVSVLAEVMWADDTMYDIQVGGVLVGDGFSEEELTIMEFRANPEASKAREKVWLEEQLENIQKRLEELNEKED